MQTPILPSVRRVLRQDLAQRYGGRFRRGRVQLSQIRSHEPTDEGGGDVIRMPLDHQPEIKYSRGREVEFPELVSQQYSSDDRRSRRSQSPPKRDLVVHRDLQSDGSGGAVGGGYGCGEPLDAVAPQDVQGDSGSEVLVRIQRDLVGSFAYVFQHGRVMSISRDESDGEGKVKR